MQAPDQESACLRSGAERLSWGQLPDPPEPAIASMSTFMPGREAADLDQAAAQADGMGVTADRLPRSGQRDLLSLHVPTVGQPGCGAHRLLARDKFCEEPIVTRQIRAPDGNPLTPAISQHAYTPDNAGNRTQNQGTVGDASTSFAYRGRTGLPRQATPATTPAS